MVRQVSDHQTKLRLRILRAHAGAHAIKPRRALRTLEVRVIDHNKSERITPTVVGRTQATGPKLRRQHRARAEPEPIASRTLARRMSVNWLDHSESLPLLDTGLQPFFPKPPLQVKGQLGSNRKRPMPTPSPKPTLPTQPSNQKKTIAIAVGGNAPKKSPSGLMPSSSKAFAF